MNFWIVLNQQGQYFFFFLKGIKIICNTHTDILILYKQTLLWVEKWQLSPSLVIISAKIIEICTKIGFFHNSEVGQVISPEQFISSCCTSREINYGFSPPPPPFYLLVIFEVLTLHIRFICCWSNNPLHAGKTFVL